MRRVAISGGTGFIGAHLVRRRVERGEEAHLLARPESPVWRLGDAARDVEIHRIPPGDRRALERHLAEIRPHEILHLAAATRRAPASDLSDAGASLREDLESLLALVSAAAALDPAPELFLRAGTLAEYGFSAEAAAEERREAPADAYAAAMTAGTHYLQMLQPRLPFPAMTLRLALVYGPMQSERFFMAEMMRACVEGRPTRLRRPHDRRDVLHVEDVVQAFEAVARRPERGAVLNIGSGRSSSMADIAGEILRAAGADPALLVMDDQPREQARQLLLNCRRARERWGWSATVSLRSGVTRTLDWLRGEPLHSR